MIVRIRRSDEYLQQQALASGESAPREVNVTFGPDDLRSVPDKVARRYCRAGQWSHEAKPPVVYAHKGGTIITDGMWQHDGESITIEEWITLAEAAWAAAESEAATVRAAAETQRAEEKQVLRIYKGEVEAAWERACTGPPYPDTVAIPSSPRGICWQAAESCRLRVCEAFVDRMQQREDWLAAQKREAAEAQARARHAQLDCIVRRLGSAEQVERWEADVLAHREVIALAIAEATEPLRAAGLTLLDTSECHVPVCCDAEVDEFADEVRRLTGEQWVVAKLARSLIPETAPIEYRRDRRLCECCGTSRGLVYARAEWETADRIEVTVEVSLDAGPANPDSYVQG